MKIITLLFSFLFIASFALSQNKEQKELVVFLVRHAEKASKSSDPELINAGKLRAKLLAEILQDAEIENIHSTNFKRTKNTAAPVAALLGLVVEEYNPRNLAEMAKQMIETGGRHLVVGHSNTTPELVKILGGKPGPDINEKAEYDRLYILTLAENGETSTVLLRYGKKYKPVEK